MKTRKLIRAELKKIFLRPTVFLFVTGIVIILLITALLFEPAARSTEIHISGYTSNTVYQNINNFISGTGTAPENMRKIDDEIDKTKSLIDRYLNPSVDILQDLQNAVDALCKSEANGTDLSGDWENIRTAFTNPSPQFDYLKSRYDLLRTHINGILAIAKTLKPNDPLTAEKLPYYITDEIFDQLAGEHGVLSRAKTILDSIDDSLISQNVAALRQRYDQFVALGLLDTINPSRQGAVNRLIAEIEPIAFDVIKLAALEELCFGADSDYYKKMTALLTQMIDMRDDVVLGDSTSAADRAAARQLFEQYKANTWQAVAVARDKLLLLLATDKTDAEMQNFITYNGFNRYAITSSVARNEYLLASDTFINQYYEAFEWNVLSGTDSKAWDYVFFTMEIVTAFVILVGCYLASYLVAGEQSAGTMKMLATTPFSRRKILTSKVTATLMFVFFFILLALAASLLIGHFMFGGLTGSSMLLLFNGQSAFSLPVVVVLLLALASAVMKIILFVSLAFLLSSRFNGSIGPVLISFVCYILTLVFNQVLAVYHWFQYLPFAHVDFFKYFVFPSGSVNVFTTPVYTSFWVGLLIPLGLIALFFTMSHIIFKRKDLA